MVTVSFSGDGVPVVEDELSFNGEGVFDGGSLVGLCSAFDLDNVPLFIDFIFSISRSKSSSEMTTGFDRDERNEGGMTISMGAVSTPERDLEKLLFGDEGVDTGSVTVRFSSFLSGGFSIFRVFPIPCWFSVSPVSLRAPILFFLYHK